MSSSVKEDEAAMSAWLDLHDAILTLAEVYGGVDRDILWEVCSEGVETAIRSLQQDTAA
jgi:hypothetical protein